MIWFGIDIINFLFLVFVYFLFASCSKGQVIDTHVTSQTKGISPKTISRLFRLAGFSADLVKQFSHTLGKEDIRSESQNNTAELYNLGKG